MASALLVGTWGLFGLGGMLVGTIYQAGAGSATYRQLQETLEDVEKDYDEWVKKYEDLYQEYATLRLEIENLVLSLASQTARLRDDTQDIIVELNQKAIIINWLWFGIILLVVFLLIFKRFKTGRFFMEIINYPFILFITAIVNGFLYLFGIEQYNWPKNPFTESNDESTNYIYKMKNSKPPDNIFLFITIIIIVGLIIGITYLLLYCRFRKENEYFRDLYNDPKYSSFIKYSKSNQEKHKKIRKEKKNNFKFNKKYDKIYRWESFNKDLIDDLEGKVCCNDDTINGNKPAVCNDTQCVYTTKGFIGENQTSSPNKNNNNQIWRPLKGISINGINQDKKYEGAPLFET